MTHDQAADQMLNDCLQWLHEEVEEYTNVDGYDFDAADLIYGLMKAMRPNWIEESIDD